MRILYIISFVFITGMSACTVLPPEPMAHSNEYGPVFPVGKEKMRVNTGAIYSGRQSDNFFGRSRTYQVGDVITVLLNESTQAARSSKSDVNRRSSNDVAPKGLQEQASILPGPLKGLGVLGGNISNSGSGTADQTASLSGSVAVTVVNILANGNLVLRGEKQLALTEGTEVIQVAGIIRPEDVAPNNTVQSRRLANAQIIYRGSGDLAAASKPGWGTSAFLKLWPF